MSIHDRIKAALAGEIEPETLGPYWQHDLAMPVYQMACKLLDMPKEQRARVTATLPPRILDLCRAEAVRLSTLRRQ